MNDLQNKLTREYCYNIVNGVYDKDCVDFDRVYNSVYNAMLNDSKIKLINKATNYGIMIRLDNQWELKKCVMDSENTLRIVVGARLGREYYIDDYGKTWYLKDDDIKDE